jgi:hypothetical protein
MNIFCFNTDDILAIFSVDDLFVLKSRTTALPEIKDTDLLLEGIDYFRLLSERSGQILRVNTKRTRVYV